MTATRAVVIHCDYLDCPRSYTGGERIRAVRRQARSDGWRYVGNGRHDFPDHANPEAGWIPIGRGAITSTTNAARTSPDPFGDRIRLDRGVPLGGDEGSVIV